MNRDTVMLSVWFLQVRASVASRHWPHPPQQSHSRQTEVFFCFQLPEIFPMSHLASVEQFHCRCQTLNARCPCCGLQQVCRARVAAGLLLLLQLLQTLSSKRICPNKKMHLSKLPNSFSVVPNIPSCGQKQVSCLQSCICCRPSPQTEYVQITKWICPNCPIHLSTLPNIPSFGLQQICRAVSTAKLQLLQTLSSKCISPNFKMYLF